MCAEAYNPDDDVDDENEPRIVHSKTDEQRHRLQEACKDILLFKTLELVRPLIVMLCSSKAKTVVLFKNELIVDPGKELIQEAIVLAQ